MYLKRGQLPIIIIHSIALFIYTIIFLSRANYEFLGYVGVIAFFMTVVLSTNKKVNYPNGILWGLTIWSILHMSGGGMIIAGKRLYDIMLINIVGSPYFILRYDQFVHAVGFYVATLVMFHILKPHLKRDIKKWVAISIVIIMAGLGAGAVNEIIEFIASIFVPSNGVGGYVNTSLDLISNLIGAMAAMSYVIIKKRVKKKK